MPQQPRRAQSFLLRKWSYDLDTNRAFEFLRRLSQHHNIKLRDVAAWVVEHRTSDDVDLAVTTPTGEVAAI